MGKAKEIAIGGQAVIEGVMMRGPEHIATCVRRKDGSLELKKDKFDSITKKIKIFGLPLVRGFVSLIEMMIIGVKTLTFSASRYELDYVDEKEAAKSSFRKKSEEFFSYVFAFGFAILLFGVVPYFLSQKMDNNAMFNLLAGSIRIVFFVGYVWGIGKLKDVKRVFQYHGAEHKSVHAWENKSNLDPKSVQQFTTLHPRCGTSFIFLVMLIAILMFSIVDTLVQMYWLEKILWWQQQHSHLVLIMKRRQKLFRILLLKKLQNLHQK
jgi:uncharacterized protein YqhQ